MDKEAAWRQAAREELAGRLAGISRAMGRPLVGEVLMKDPGGAGGAPAPSPALRALAEAVVQAVLDLSRQRAKLTPGDLAEMLASTFAQQRRQHPELAPELFSRLEAEAAFLFNLPRLLRLARQGMSLPPAQAASLQAGEEIVPGRSPAFKKVLRDLEQVAETDFPVLLTGETGTGKELLARRLHRLSPRREGPFIAVNCAALSPALLENELFGHEKGAFTGAEASSRGYIREAHHGTLFLDEIGETEANFQVRLLRVLEQREVVPVGGTRGREVDFRLVCASHQDLDKLAAQGGFKPALLYRIAVVPLRLPPLRRRAEDLPELARHFLAKACLLAKRTRALSPEVLEVLGRYDWPGNLRQLQNVLQQMVALSRQYQIGLDDLPDELRQGRAEDYAARLAGLEGITSRWAGDLAALLAENRGRLLVNQAVRDRLGCSDSTAKNLLRLLSDAGLLTVSGRRGGRRYLVGDP
jgi:DNA-binding NtrC family response regulator